MCSVLRVYSFSLAQWLSWLERRPVTAEVEGSSPFWVVSAIWDHSSAGRAPALQAGGHRFEPCWSHFSNKYADMAQLAEQLICNQQVNGSSPFIGFMDGFPSGQRGQTVNLLAPPSKVRILLHPLRNEQGEPVGDNQSGSNPSPSIKIY